MRADAEPSRARRLSAIDPEAWTALRFEFHPSLRRLELEWNTAAVWKAMSPDETPPAPERRGARCRGCCGARICRTIFVQ